MSYNLFLDDVRWPFTCIPYVHTFGISPHVYSDNKFLVVRDYREFVACINEKGLPNIVSFDHDLADDHYEVDFQDWNDYSSNDLQVEETGMDAAKWLINYCMDHSLPLPTYYVHSMNPVGRENIKSLLDNYSKLTK